MHLGHVGLLLFWSIMMVHVTLNVAYRGMRVATRCAAASITTRAFSALGDTSRVYLNVPFEEKDEVKKRGARWDTEANKWYVEGAADHFARWTGSLPQQQHKAVLKDSKLNVPFAEKDEVKALGARWDKEGKHWFVPSGMDPAPFEKWKDAHSSPSPNTKTSTILSPSPSSGTSPSRKGNAEKRGTADSSSGPSVLFLDIETSGLPERTKSGTYPPPDALAVYDGARAVQISAIKCQLPSMKQIDAFSLILQPPQGMEITNAQYHGVTTERARKEGVEFKVVAARLEKMLAGEGRAGPVLVAHNLDFDLAILRSELHRHGEKALLGRVEGAKKLCTMQLGQAVVGVFDVRGKPKVPTMRELYAYAVGADQARAAGDLGVEELREAFQKLLERGVVSMPMIEGL